MAMSEKELLCDVRRMIARIRLMAKPFRNYHDRAEAAVTEIETFLCYEEYQRAYDCAEAAVARMAEETGPIYYHNAMQVWNDVRGRMADQLFQAILPMVLRAKNAFDSYDWLRCIDASRDVFINCKRASLSTTQAR